MRPRLEGKRRWRERDERKRRKDKPAGGGEPKLGEHHWRRVVAEPDRFETELYTALAVTADEFADLIAQVKGYRDGFVAHRDEERMARLPKLELPKKAVAFLHEQLAGETSREGWLERGLPTTAEQLDERYAQASREAQSVYAEALAPLAATER